MPPETRRHLPALLAWRVFSAQPRQPAPALRRCARALRPNAVPWSERQRSVGLLRTSESFASLLSLLRVTRHVGCVWFARLRRQEPATSDRGDIVRLR